MRRLLLAILVIAAALQAFSLWREVGSSLAYLAARRLDASGGYGDALAQMETAARLRGDDPNLRAWVGDIAQHTFEWRGSVPPVSARDLLDRSWAGYAGAVTLAPLDAWSWSGLAEIALKRAQLDDEGAGVSIETIETRARGVLDPGRLVALGAAELAVDLKPSGYQEMDVLASVLEATGDVERAADTYVKSARVMPAPSFHVWGSDRRFPDAIYSRLKDALLAGIEASPPYERSLLHLECARFAREQGDGTTAIAEARLSERDARNTYERHQSAMMLGTALAATDPKEALEAWRRASRTGYDPAIVALNMAVLERGLGKGGDACAHYGDAVREMSTDSTLRIAAAQTCEQAGELETAEKLLREGISVPSKAMPLARELVAFLERSHRFHTARADVSAWIDDDPANTEFRGWLQEIADSEAAAASTTR
ncbi:MAG TPA: hypothetical protein VFV19_03470 [Candidatus Polarisedimenticolaceae bacterium]|nr:hypothetical protein [Candidatus Polarisedimenticolaceae bacterium]